MAQGNSLDLHGIINPDLKAQEIVKQFDRWKESRNVHDTQSRGVRNYVFAVDTETTDNSVNPFFNNMTTPKLTQIKDNLKANYMSVLFGREDWVNWEAHDSDAADKDKRKLIESYVRSVVRTSKMKKVFSKLLDDWITFGNCYSQLQWVNESKIVKNALGDDEEIPGYVGPKLFRIDYNDIVYNVTASDWESTPKIVRYLKSMGELENDILEKPEQSDMAKALLGKIKTNRQAILTGRRSGNASGNSELDKSQGFVADGFDNIEAYYNSEMVEILEFRGNLWTTEGYFKDYRVVIADRTGVLEEGPIDSWSKTSYMYHSSWRDRDNNLVGMGPLDNLVGMQYMIDKLQNSKADVWDRIVNPAEVIIGDVSEYQSEGKKGAPGFIHYLPEGGSVTHLRPDTTALNADLQIEFLATLMERMAGAPEQSLGVRTPGEKTALEVQTLTEGASKLFITQTMKFEEDVVEPALNDIIEMARRMLVGDVLVRAQDNTFGVDEFLKVTKDDLTAKGKLYPKGSSHFLRQSLAAQNINLMLQNPNIFQKISPHLDGLELAKQMEELIGLEQFNLIGENRGVLRDIQTQAIVQSGEQSLGEQAEVPEEDALSGEEGQAPPPQQEEQ